MHTYPYIYKYIHSARSFPDLIAFCPVGFGNRCGYFSAFNCIIWHQTDTDARTCRSLVYIICACRLSLWFVNTILRHVFPFAHSHYLFLLCSFLMSLEWKSFGNKPDAKWKRIVSNVRCDQSLKVHSLFLCIKSKGMVVNLSKYCYIGNCCGNRDRREKKKTLYATCSVGKIFFFCCCCCLI